ncbi:MULTISPECIES: ABC transporter permease [Aerococcus]|uniref:ABC transporter permease n=3 Tax=Aerococcus TaxID=1375 RepID=A0ABT4C2A1_9LACT|nr:MULTISPECIES: ABC transporter permease [Aerococcus]AEA00794.1 ABC transporter, permease protein [Aerococcus sp. Group 1]AMB95801.1 amino acid ABC transporter permease [Aerococcus urinae]KAA9239016.1 ABC transporter permease [Aerococcus urinae]MCY3030487.1 ABC transporter permease [Aerococcus sp. Group 1]MCY3032381.1 ABC transporter permease [Aerococcus urinae]
MADITDLSVWQQLLYYYSENSSYVISQFFQQMLMALYGTIFACLLAIPLGFYIARREKLANVVISIANIIQTVPALALLSVLMLYLGLGSNLVVLTVFLYSLLPILRNTYTGVRNIDAGIIDVGKGMGMTKMQVILKVEFPLAFPVILGGIRNAFITAIGIATIGTFVGAGGLGSILTRGVNASEGTSIILAGVIPIALMSIVADYLMELLERRLSPNASKNK